MLLSYKGAEACSRHHSNSMQVVHMWCTFCTPHSCYWLSHQGQWLHLSTHPPVAPLDASIPLKHLLAHPGAFLAFESAKAQQRTACCTHLACHCQDYLCKSRSALVLQSVAIPMQGAAARSDGKQLAPLLVGLNLPCGSQACPPT